MPSWHKIFCIWMIYAILTWNHAFKICTESKKPFLILECMSESLRWSPLALDDGEHVVLGDAYFMTHGTYRFPPHSKRMRYLYVSHPQLSKCCYFYEHMATQKCMYCDGIMFPKGKPKIHIQTNEKYMYCQQSYNMSFPNVRQSKHLFSNIFLNYKKDNVCSSTFAHTGLLKKVWPGVFRGHWMSNKIIMSVK